jgi:hypothetical protein
VLGPAAEAATAAAEGPGADPSRSLRGGEAREGGGVLGLSSIVRLSARVRSKSEANCLLDLYMRMDMGVVRNSNTAEGPGKRDRYGNEPARTRRRPTRKSSARRRSPAPAPGPPRTRAEGAAAAPARRTAPRRWGRGTPRCGRAPFRGRGGLNTPLGEAADGYHHPHPKCVLPTKPTTPAASAWARPPETRRPCWQPPPT